MKNLIRGGQTSIHFVHMTSQLFTTLVKIAILVIIVGDLTYVISKFGFYEFKEVIIYYMAKILMLFGLDNVHINFVGRAGNIYDLKSAEIVKNVNLVIQKNRIISAFITGFITGIFLAFCSIASLLVLFAYRGKKMAKEKFIRGAKIVSTRNLRKKIQSFNIKESLRTGNLFNYSSYKILSIPFPKNNEFLHTIVLGSTGTGKTNAILDIVDQVRKNGDRAIIYDKMGTYTATYYNENKDVILNPLDARSKSWSFFEEIRTESDYDYLASAFIPEKKDSSGPFWTDSARRVFAVFAKKLKEEKGDVTNQEFVDALLKSNYKMLAQYLTGTEASSLISAESEKTSLSILAILAAYISSMKYLHDEKEHFSIRNWIEREESEGGFLFISSRSDQHESLMPLISTWIDIAIKSLLSVEQNNYSNAKPRRIWIILDEIGSLQQLPSLLDGLAQSRQFGGAFLLSMHSISQLRSIYGRDKTDTITSLCRNKIFFAGADEETSDYCSQNLGYQEVEEIKEGISYGANDIRDGVNLNTHKSLKRIVISSEIMNMKALQAYIKFAGDFPISKILFKIKNRKKTAPRFVDITSNSFREETKESFAVNEVEEEPVTEENLPQEENKEETQVNNNPLSQEKKRREFL